MKKLLLIVTALSLTVSMAGMTASAHGGHHGGGHHSSAKTKIVYHCEKDCAFTDVDSDGICDECGNYGYYCEKDCTFTDCDEDGICDDCGTKGVCSYKSKARSRTCHR